MSMSLDLSGSDDEDHSTLELSEFPSPSSLTNYGNIAGGKLNPEDKAGHLSRFTFWYLNPMFQLGHQRPLEEPDIPPLSTQDRSLTVSSKFQTAWSEEVEKPVERIHLPLAFNRAFGFDFWIAALWKLINDVAQFVQPAMIGYITYFISHDEPLWKGMLYVLVLLVVPVIQSLALHRYFHVCFRTGMHLRTAVTTSVYQKAVLLSNSAKLKTTTGEITNLMSTDARRLLDLTPYLQTLWSGPLQIIISLVLLYRLMGPASLAGLAAMLVMIPVNAFVARFQALFQAELMKVKDERVRMMNEYLNGMRVIKFFAWEESFRHKITAVREAELRVLLKSQLLSAVGSFFWTMTPILVSMSSFATYSALGHDLTNEVIFPAIAIFNILRFPISMFPRVVSSVVSAKVSFDRLQSFLLQPELSSLTDSHYDRSDETFMALYPNEVVEPVISLQDASFDWVDRNQLDDDDEAEEQDYSPNTSRSILNNLSISVQPGQLVVMLGPVGSGKSSFLSGILGDMHLKSGRATIRGRVAYVPQSAWMKNDTIRNNITFGEPFDAPRFEQTISVCALRPDLQVLPGGDQCEIGEKGINLSGGQKQRLNIARAVYSDADIYLLDDPLSAVDIHVGTHIFEQCILGHLKQKTRILVTHQLYTLSRADLIVYLKDGEIVEMGSYEELLRLQGEVATLVTTHAGLGHTEDSTSSPESTPESTPSSPDPDNKSKSGPTSELIAAEERDIGGVKTQVYRSYAKAIGLPIILMLIMPAVTQILTIYSNYWLSYWGTQTVGVLSNQTSTRVLVAVRESEHSQGWYMMIFIVLSLSAGVSSFFSALSLCFGSLNASRSLHADTLHSVFRATLSYFESTPVGRILNRFSRDQECIDNSLPGTMQSLLACLAGVLGTIFLVLTASPLFLLVVVPLGVGYYYTSRYYLETSRELKRLDSNTNSPIYAHFSETLNGVTTIRAYRATQRFIQENAEKLDKNLRLYWPMTASNRWLGLRLEFIATLVTVFIALFAVLGRHWVQPGLIGLALTYSLGITGALSWLVRMATDTETQMNAVERMIQYQQVPQEAELITFRDPHSAWPEQGRIDFSNVVMRYRPDLPPALRGISAVVYPREKIGIVGRTGSGKSSLVATLFRLIELDSGTITIDSIDIASIGLAPLRRAIAIIPQDPVLFSGSIRTNLDPFDEYEDFQIWDALARVDLKKVVDALADGLASDVSEEGSNFSLGQRQLFCLARALLRHAKIIVLDEATSAVDADTDHLIQQTIRSNLDATILTVAHRLNTIIDYDRIMVLDQGHLVEFDSPQALLDNPSSMFSSMVGSNEHLRNLARSATPETPASNQIFLPNIQNDPFSADLFDE